MTPTGVISNKSVVVSTYLEELPERVCLTHA